MTSRSTLRELTLFAAVTLCAMSAGVARADDSVPMPVPNSVFTTPATTENTGPKIKIAVDSFLEGRDVEDTLFKTSGSLLDINPRVDITYNSWMSFDLIADAVWVTGNTQSFYTQEGGSINTVFMDEAAINLTPFSFFQLHAGELYEQINPIQSIMSQNGFLGGAEQLDVNLPGIGTKISLIGVEAVPSSGTITREMVDDAPNAYFLTQTLQTETKMTPLSTTVKMALTHFEFGNLSTNVATDCELIGNSPQAFDGIGTGSRFIIGFDGFEGAAEIQTDWLRRLSTDLTASAIINNGAATDRNSGFQGQAKVTFKLGNINLIPGFTVFDMGADVDPATYTLLPYRYQNREGFSAQFNVEMVKEKVNFFGNYTKGDVIIPNPYMADRETYTIGLEAKYDLL